MDWVDYSVKGDLEAVVSQIEAELRAFSAAQPAPAASPLNFWHAIITPATAGLQQLQLSLVSPSSAAASQSTPPAQLALASAVGATAFSSLAFGERAALPTPAAAADAELACALRLRFGLQGSLLLLRKAPGYLADLLPGLATQEERRQARQLLSTALLAVENAGLTASTAVVVQVDEGGAGKGSFLGSAWDEAAQAHTELRLGVAPLWDMQWEEVQEEGQGEGEAASPASSSSSSRVKLVATPAPLASRDALLPYFCKKLVSPAGLLAGSPTDSGAAAAELVRCTTAMRWRLGWGALRGVCDFLGLPPVTSALEVLCAWEEGQGAAAPASGMAPSEAEVLAAPLLGMRLCERDAPGALLLWRRQGLGLERAALACQHVHDLAGRTRSQAEDSEGSSTEASTADSAEEERVCPLELLFQACSPALLGAEGLGGAFGSLAYPTSARLACLQAALAGALHSDEGAMAPGWALAGAGQLQAVVAGGGSGAEAGTSGSAHSSPLPPALRAAATAAPLPPTGLCTVAALQACVDGACECWEGGWGSPGELLGHFAMGAAAVAAGGLHVGGSSASGSAFEGAEEGGGGAGSLWEWLRLQLGGGGGGGGGGGQGRPVGEVLQGTLCALMSVQWGALVRALRGMWEAVEESSPSSPSTTSTQLVDSEALRGQVPQPQPQHTLPIEQQISLLMACYREAKGAHSQGSSGGGAAVQPTALRTAHHLQPSCSIALQRPPPSSAEQALEDAKAAQALGVTLPQALALLGLDSDTCAAAAHPVRRHLSLAAIRSDMAAYKAHHAGSEGSAALPAFLTWYLGVAADTLADPSAAAFVCPPASASDTASDSDSAAHGWVALWRSSPPCPAAQQQRALFHPPSLAQLTLQRLEQAPPATVLAQLCAAGAGASAASHTGPALALRAAVAQLLQLQQGLPSSSEAAVAGGEVLLREARGGVSAAAVAVCAGVLAGEGAELKAGRLGGLLGRVGGGGGGGGGGAQEQQELHALVHACVLPVQQWAEAGFWGAAVHGAALGGVGVGSRPWVALRAGSWVREAVLGLVKECSGGEGGGGLPPPCKYAVLLASRAEREAIPQAAAAAAAALPGLRHTVLAEVDRWGGSEDRGCLTLALAVQERV